MYGLPRGAAVKNLPASVGDAGDLGSVPGAGISSVGGTGNSLQDPHLGNPLDREAWRATIHEVAKNQTRLKQLTTQHYLWF